MRRLVGTFQTDHGHCATVIASAPDASYPTILAMACASRPCRGSFSRIRNIRRSPPTQCFSDRTPYRFAALINRVLYGCPSSPHAILDLGCGSGVGNIVAARRAGGRPFLALADVNPAALRLAWVNAALAEIDAASSG
jgi:hypothetical protein